MCMQIVKCEKLGQTMTAKFRAAKSVFLRYPYMLCYATLDNWLLRLCSWNRSIMPEDKFHKLADDTIHDLLEKLEVMDSSISSSYLSTSLEASLRNISVQHLSLANIVLCVLFQEYGDSQQMEGFDIDYGVSYSEMSCDHVSFTILHPFAHWITDIILLISLSLRIKF